MCHGVSRDGGIDNSTVRHSHLASLAGLACDVPCLTGVFVPACASLARYSGAAKRFALFLNSAWSSHCARKLACGTPCFIGLTTACFAHCARPPCAPRPFTPSGLRRLRPVSAIGGGLRTPLSRSPLVFLRAGGRLPGGFASVHFCAILCTGFSHFSRLRGSGKACIICNSTHCFFVGRNFIWPTQMLSR